MIVIQNIILMRKKCSVFLLKIKDKKKFINISFVLQLKYYTLINYTKFEPCVKKMTRIKE